MKKLLKNQILSVLLLSIIIFTNAIFPLKVNALDSDLGVDDLEKIEDMEDLLKDIETYLEKELESVEEDKDTEDNILDNSEIEDLNLGKDLEDLKLIEKIMEEENKGHIERAAMTSGNYMFSQYKTSLIKNKLKKLIDTIDIFELERIKSSYQAEKDLAEDIGQIILKVANLYSNIESIRDFNSAIRAVKNTVEDIRYIKELIKTLKVKFSINKLEKNLNEDYIREIERYIDNKIVKLALKDEARNFFIIRLDSSVNKELLKLEAFSSGINITNNTGPIQEIDTRLEEIQKVIKIEEEQIYKHINVVGKTDDLENKLAKINLDYLTYIENIKKHLDEIKNYEKIKLSGDREIKEDLNLLEAKIEKIKQNIYQLKDEDFFEIEKTSNIIKFKIDTQEDSKLRRENKDLYSKLEKDYNSIKFDYTLYYDLVDFQDEVNHINYYSKDLEKKVENLENRINKQEDGSKRLENRKILNQIKIHLDQLRILEEHIRGLEDINNRVEKIKLNKHGYSKKIKDLNYYKEELDKYRGFKDLEELVNTLLEKIELKIEELNYLNNKVELSLK